MAFRRRRFFRRRVNGKLSKKHYTWVTSLNTKCALTTLNHCVPEVEAAFCCPSQAQLVLLDNAVIQSSFQDSIRVVRVHGELAFNWNLDEIYASLGILFPTCDSFAEALSLYQSKFTGYATSGIAIREIHNGDLNTLPRMNPTEDFDFSEGRWKMMRFHTHTRQNSLTAALQCDSVISGVQGVCSSVTGTSPGATTTVCSAFPLGDQTVTHGYNFMVHSNLYGWKWRYNNRCSLRVRENQLPVMSVGWANVDFAGTTLPAPRLDMVGTLKLLIEVG